MIVMSIQFKFASLFPIPLNRKKPSNSFVAKPGCIHVKSDTFLKLYCDIKLLVDVSAPVSVEELVGVKDVPFTCFTRYRRKINIVTCSWF